MKLRIQRLVIVVCVVTMAGFTAVKILHSRQSKALQEAVETSNEKFGEIFSVAMENDPTTVDYKALESALSERDAAESARDKHRRMSDNYDRGFFALLLMLWGATWLVNRANTRTES